MRNCQPLQMAAAMLTALALVPAGAHFFELPHKIHLSQADYFIVQGIYAGWAFLGIFIILAIMAHAALAVALNRQTVWRWYAVAAGLLILGLAIFFTFTFPANQATANWTLPTPNWQNLRQQWEYSHAAGAVLTLLALGCSLLALIHYQRPAANQK